MSIIQLGWNHSLCKGDVRERRQYKKIQRKRTRRAAQTIIQEGLEQMYQVPVKLDKPRTISKSRWWGRCYADGDAVYYTRRILRATAATVMVQPAMVAP